VSFATRGGADHDQSANTLIWPPRGGQIITRDLRQAV
jgi:hypothetical protein